jgi:hypothetical protein
MYKKRINRDRLRQRMARNGIDRPFPVSLLWLNRLIDKDLADVARCLLFTREQGKPDRRVRRDRTIGEGIATSQKIHRVILLR